MMKYDQTTVVIPCEKDVKHTATIIWLHGLADESNGWAEELYPIKGEHVSLVFPKANENYVTLYDTKMPSWFDIGADSYKGEDVEGIRASSKIVIDAIRKEIQGTPERPGIPPNRIVLGGFSQGATMALHIGLNGPEQLAGTVCLSGYLPMIEQIKWDYIKRPHIFLGQGDMDKLVPVHFGTMTYKALKDNVPKVDFKIYEGVGHNWNKDELSDLKEYFGKVLPPI